MQKKVFHNFLNKNRGRWKEEKTQEKREGRKKGENKGQEVGGKSEILYSHQ